MDTRTRISRIATIESARVMNDACDYGSIAEGKVADPLVLNGNPREGLAALGKFETVMRGGSCTMPPSSSALCYILGAIGAGGAHEDKEPRFYHPT
jgi:hypothetical protein